MIFYRVKATIEQKNEVQEESQERERRSLSRQRAEIICAETTVFNSVFDERYIFTVSAHKSRINMNVISKEPITELYIQQYLSTIDVQSTEIQMEEVTWREIYTSVRLGRMFPSAGYGSSFIEWIFKRNPQPYGSYGNGSAMRVGTIASFYPNDLQRALSVAKISAEVSHNHPEAIKAVECTTEMIWLSNKGGVKKMRLEKMLRKSITS